MGTPRKTPKVPPVALLTHRPDPGLYSRLERAVEQLPKEVKVEGLENRLRKYPEGVSGWELKPFMEMVGLTTDATVPRKFLSDLVRQTSPAFTHREGVLAEGGSLPFLGRQGDVWDAAGQLGSPTVVGEPQFKNATESGGDNYRVNLLMQPTLTLPQSPSVGYPTWHGGHWGSHPNTIAHLRTKDAGDAVRIQELQSDIRNANVRHLAEMKDFEENFDPKTHQDLWPQHQVPLYDAYPEVLLKSLLLRAAREGKRAIEIAPFDAISKYVSMRPEGIQHVYGGQVPGTLIRAARPLGGLVDAEPFTHGSNRSKDPSYVFSRAVEDNLSASDRRLDAARRAIVSRAGPGAAPSLIPAHTLIHARNSVPDAEALLRRLLAGREEIGFGGPAGMRLLEQEMPNIMREVDFWNEERARTSINGPLISQMYDPRYRPTDLDDDDFPTVPPASKRFEIPDAVRRKILERGIGLGVLAPLLQENEEQR